MNYILVKWWGLLKLCVLLSGILNDYYWHLSRNANKVSVFGSLRKRIRVNKVHQLENGLVTKSETQSTFIYSSSFTKHINTCERHSTSQTYLNKENTRTSHGLKYFVQIFYDTLFWKNDQREHKFVWTISENRRGGYDGPGYVYILLVKENNGERKMRLYLEIFNW